MKEPQGICANAALCWPEESLQSRPASCFKVEWDPKGHRGKQKTIYTFQYVLLLKDLEPTKYVFLALPQDPYIQSWQLLPLL